MSPFTHPLATTLSRGPSQPGVRREGGGGGEEEEGLSYHSNPGLLAPKSVRWEGPGVGVGAGTDGCLPEPKRKHSDRGLAWSQDSRERRARAGQRRDPKAEERFQPLLPRRPAAEWEKRCGVRPPPSGAQDRASGLVLPGTWKMPVPWFLLSLALGRSRGPLLRGLGPQDTARCSPVSLGPWAG